MSETPRDVFEALLTEWREWAEDWPSNEFRDGSRDAERAEWLRRYDDAARNEAMAALAEQEKQLREEDVAAGLVHAALEAAEYDAMRAEREDGEL